MGLTLSGAAVADPVPPTIAAYNQKLDLALDQFPSLEAQIASIADDIAYDNHDLDDGLRAGIIKLAMLDAVPHVAAVFQAVREEYPDLEKPRLIHESIRRLVDLMVNDLLDQTERNLTAAKIRSSEDVREAGHVLARFSDHMETEDNKIKSFLLNRMYKDSTVLQQASAGCERLTDLFESLHTNPEQLPEEWLREAAEPKSAVTARVVADYIAGMTDRYAIHLHRNMFADKAVGS